MILHNIALPTEHREFTDTLRRAQSGALAFMRPKPCPFPLLRIGGDGDGAYLVPDDLAGIAACFSPGVDRIKRFEDELLERFDIPSHMCDKSCDISRLTTPLVEGRQSFLKKWLDINGAEDSIALADWVAERAPGEDDLLLQIDIEGAEFRNIIHTDDAVLRRFRIITIELHLLDELNDPNAVAAVFAPFFDKLERSFVCVHAHPNNNMPAVPIDGTDTLMPRVIELTLLRKDRFEGIDPAAMIAPQLPHPEDILRNVLDKPPLNLDDSWRLAPPSPASMHKMVGDEIAYRKMREETWARLDQDLRQETHHWMNRLAAALTRAGTLPPAKAPGPLSDVARGKPFRLSRPRWCDPQTGVVSGKAPFFFHSAYEAMPSITVDLEGAFRLHQITVSNRTDDHFGRARSLFAIVHEGEDLAGGHAFQFPHDPDFLQGRRSDLSIPLPGVPGRYVTLSCPLRTSLHFSDLRILGVPAGG